MPLIKKPEMFHYAAECYNRLNERKKAIENLSMCQGLRMKKSGNGKESLAKRQCKVYNKREWKVRCEKRGCNNILKRSQIKDPHGKSSTK